MRLTSFVTLSAALLVSTTAMAKTKAPAEAEQSPTEKVAVDKKICKRLATSGTRMAERVCLTKQEWEKVEQQAK